MTLKELLSELGSRTGMGEVAFDPAEGGVLTIDDMPIAIEGLPDDEGILLTASLGVVPPFNREGVYRAILMANTDGAATGGSSLGINDEYDEILLCRTILKGEIDYDTFQAELVVFQQVATHWHDRIKRGDIAPHAAAATDAGGAPATPADEIQIHV